MLRYRRTPLRWTFVKHVRQEPYEFLVDNRNDAVAASIIKRRMLRTTSVSAERITGVAAPNARVAACNLSLAPYAPDSDTLCLETRADARGRFVLEGPALRGGDLVRVLAARTSPLDLRLPGAARRPEAEVQGLRLYCSQGTGTLVNLLSRARIADPGIRLLFVNTRDGSETEVTLDEAGALPKRQTLAARAGDQIDIFVAPAGGDFPEDKWASLIAQSPRAKDREPPPANGSKVTGTRALAALYVDGISADDPMQGDVGDCSIIATLSAIAHTSPDRIAQLIDFDDATGVATVRLKRWDAARRDFVDEPISISNAFPANRSGLVYAHSRDDGESWVSVIEKAYAKWKGGYEAAAVGYPYAAFEALLGEKGEQIFLGLEDDATAFAKLQDADARPTVAVTHAGPKKAMQREGLVEDHAYTVLGAFVRDGERYVRVRNPWGSFEPRGNGADDGEFVLSFESFKKRFAYACRA